MVAIPRSRGLHGVQPPEPDASALEAESETNAPRVLGAERGPSSGTVPAARVAAVRPRPSPPGSRDILLLIERLDE
ncbi:MAG TPA: hypothetical protein VJG13_02620 [Thermoanaerobaculia bacterium]|nr:hypothetical protein [Thermoanaerobaculia bacterium]